MNNLDVYLKSRHDFVNQFQLLYSYKQLGKDDKVNSMLDELYNDLKQEQLFLNTPCRKFVQEVFEHKISLSGSKWTFEIECINDDYYHRNLILSDNILFSIFYIWVNDLGIDFEGIHSHLGLIVEEEFVTLIIKINDVQLDESKIKKCFSSYNTEIISLTNDTSELEFFININELEV
nr:Spo0B domain-containing protein [Mammaliicoccus sp. Marseille-Q6498]